MPTTHVERLIQSVLALKHQWRNPLNQMRSSAVGLHLLPIELWEEIFAIATDEATQWAAWCTISNPFFTVKEEDHLREPTPHESRCLLHTRHSIILVCKSWYFMGIPILWSHLQFDEKDPRNIATTIYSALKRNPTLTAHVLRLTIKPEFRDTNLIKPEKLDVVAKFVGLLTNIEAISCSLPYAAHLNPSIQPGIVMVNNRSIMGQHGAYRASISVRPLFHDSFWIHCQTLSLAVVSSFGDVWRVLYGQHKIKFNNLINLQLEISQRGFLEQLRQFWRFPVLKNLHIIAHPSEHHMPIIKHTRLTLEKLYISLASVYVGWSPMVVMPNLKEIYLNDNCWYINRPDTWYTLIQAPVLHRFVMLWDRYSERKMYSRTKLLPIIAGILSHYTSLEELVIIVPMGKWVQSFGRDTHVILLLKDISLWCGSVTVEMVTGKHAERIRYAKGSLPIDQLGILEYDGSFYTQSDL